MKKTLLLNLLGAFAFTLTAVYGVATTNAAFIKKGTSHGISYISGGVGIDERAAMERMARGYNLKLVFAEPSRPYLANVSVESRDASGKRLVETTDNGPWFFAKLPDGNYRVVATFEGKKEAREVEIGKNLPTVTEAQPAKTEAARVESGKNVQSATKARPVKTKAKEMEASKRIQTVTFYWKA